jgi:MFS family permease
MIASLFLSAIVQVSMGRVVDRFGARRILLAACVVAAGGIAVQLMTAHPLGLLASALVAGIGGGTYYVAAAPFLARSAEPEQRTRLYALDTVVVLAGTAVGTAGGGQLAAALGGAGGFAATDRYWLTLLAGSATGVIGFVPLLLTVDSAVGRPSAGAARREAAGGAALGGNPSSAGTGRSVWRGAVSDPVVLELAAVALLGGLGAGLFAPYLNLFFVEAHHAGPATYGWLSAGGTSLRLVATLLAPRLGVRFGTVRAIAGAQVLSVPLLLVLGFAPQIALAGAAMVLRQAVANMVTPLQVSFTMGAVRPAARGTANAAILLAANAAAGAGTLAGGALIARSGYQATFAVAATFYCAAALLFFVWFRAAGQSDAQAAGGA